MTDQLTSAVLRFIELVRKKSEDVKVVSTQETGCRPHVCLMSLSQNILMNKLPNQMIMHIDMSILSVLFRGCILQHCSVTESVNTQAIELLKTINTPGTSSMN